MPYKDPEVKKAYRRDWMGRHREKKPWLSVEINNRWKASHPGAAAAATARWRKKNPEKAKAQRRRWWEGRWRRDQVWRAKVIKRTVAGNKRRLADLRLLKSLGPKPVVKIRKVVWPWR